MSNGSSFRWKGYSDANPSESIQRSEIPGLAVAVVFPFMPGIETLELPVKQFKDYSIKQKANRVRTLIDWLYKNKDEGLVLAGMAHTHSQLDAAEFGMRIIESFEGMSVVPHYAQYRLEFGEDAIDFSQAVALIYYYVTLSFGTLRAGLKLPEGYRDVIVLMDRFPGTEPKGIKPGQNIPLQISHKFLNFIQTETKLGKDLVEENKKVGLSVDFATQDWWRFSGSPIWLKGKSHPHFILPDWLCAACTISHYSEEYIRKINDDKRAKEIVSAMSDLYDCFKSFEIFSLGSEVLSLITAENRVWTIPEEAREYITEKARPIT